MIIMELYKMAIDKKTKTLGKSIASLVGEALGLVIEAVERVPPVSGYSALHDILYGDMKDPSENTQKPEQSQETQEYRL